jgi:chromosome segregation ATPase
MAERAQTDSADELARSRAEVERLRGLLIEQEAELGKLRGRVEELEDRINRMLGFARRLRRFGPALRRLRRPRA